jgi:hypothetical protein
VVPVAENISKYILMTTCGSTVLEQLIHDPQIEVLSLASTESIFVKLAPRAQKQRDNQFDATMGTPSFLKNVATHNFQTFPTQNSNLTNKGCQSY